MKKGLCRRVKKPRRKRMAPLGRGRNLKITTEGLRTKMQLYCKRREIKKHNKLK